MCVADVPQRTLCWNRPLPAVQTWFGPVYVYLNQKPAGTPIRQLWDDAKAQVSISSFFEPSPLLHSSSPSPDPKRSDKGTFVLHRWLKKKQHGHIHGPPDQIMPTQQIEDMCQADFLSKTGTLSPFDIHPSSLHLMSGGHLLSFLRASYVNFKIPN